ncbi:hypothetical protein KIW84_035341 [Lathyrus oleraceus]|uniref:Uncharacterized protein n=1 Tax=Pisum sativum TaxID=3888 RepID=A0A9D4Y2G8_PEA|nr:hypothetical protein KIW84_035341 [Pisum sativum]
MKNNPRHSWKKEEEVKFCLRFSFSRGLRPINCDADVLKLIEDLSGIDLVDLYVEHTIDKPEIIDEAKKVHGFDVDDDVEVNNDKEDNVVVDDNVEVSNDKANNVVFDYDVKVKNDKEDNVVVDDDVEVNNDKDDNADDNIVVDNDVGVNNDDDNDTYVDYVESGGSSESDIDISGDSIDLDMTTVLNAETKTTHAQCEKYQAEFECNHGEDPDQLHTLAKSEDGKECGAMRHNKQSCKGKRDVDRAMSKGGNKNKTAGNKNKTAGNKNKKYARKTVGNMSKKSKKNPEIEIGSSSQAPIPTQLTQT